MLLEMKSQKVCHYISVWVLISVCYRCGGRWVDHNTDTHMNAKLISNKSRNASRQSVTHRGKHFVLPLPKTSATSKEAGRIVIHAIENNTEIQVEIPNTNYNKTLLMAKDEVVQLNLTRNTFTSIDGEIERNGIRIISNNEISVDALIQVTNSSDHQEHQENRFLVFPVTSLGHEYILKSYPSFRGNLEIVGVYRNTTVSIEFDARGSHDNRTYTREKKIVLNALDTFHLQGAQRLKVIGNKPVAAYSMVTCGFSGAKCGRVTKQLPAVSTWGQQYVVYSTSRHSLYTGILRVVSGNETTSVVFGDGVKSLLGYGQVIDHVVTGRLPTKIACSPSCMVTLYTTRLTCSGRGHNFCHVVPTMLSIPATNQFLSYYSIYTPYLNNGTRMLSITIQCSARDDLFMNGELLRGLVWDRSETGTWCGAVVTVTYHQRVVTIYHKDGVTKFGLTVIEQYGDYSFTYLGGRRFDVLPTKTIKNENYSVFTSRPTKAIQESKAVRIKPIESKVEQYRSATIALAVICAVMFIALAFLTLRYKVKCTSKMSKDTPMAVKPQVESEYQSIRGLPRRETGNSYVYETVKPRLPHARTPLSYLQQENDGDYENLKSHLRDSDPYIPMDEALAGSGLTEGAILLSGEDEDLYLTMKKLVETPPDEAAIETKEL